MVVLSRWLDYMESVSLPIVSREERGRKALRLV